MADVYGYILLPVKVRDVPSDRFDRYSLAEDVTNRLRDLQFVHGGVEFWGEDIGFDLNVVEADSETEALQKMADARDLRHIP